MNDLETAVKPHLKPMIQGRQRILGSGAQEALASWVFLKVLMFDQWRARGKHLIVPRRYYDTFHLKRRPPSDVKVATAAYIGGTSLGKYNDTGLHLTAPGERPQVEPDGFLATLTVHHAVLQVFGQWRHDDLEFVRATQLASASTQIWPTGVPSAWPPNGTFLDHEWLLAFEQPSARARLA